MRIALVVSLGITLAACGEDSPETSQGGTGFSGSSSGGSGTTVNAPLGEPIRGEGTFYNATGGGNCSFPESPSDLDVAAMASPLYNNAAYCGACVDVTGPSGKVRVRIVDKCPECKRGDLDMSESAFAKIADPKAGRVPITWTLVRCDVSGPIQYQIKDGASKYWTAVQVRNHAVPIERVEMEKSGTFQEAPRVDYNYFILQSGVQTDGPFKVRVYGLGGKMLEDTIPAPKAEAISSGLTNF